MRVKSRCRRVDIDLRDIKYRSIFMTRFVNDLKGAAFFLAISLNSNEGLKQNRNAAGSCVLPVWLRKY